MMKRFLKLVRGLSFVSDRLAMGANAVGTLTVLALVVMVNYDVVARGVFNTPFMGAVELVQFSMVLIVFLQLPDVVRVNRLTRSDGFLLILEARAPRVKAVLSFGIETVAAVFMALVAIAIWPQFVEMWETQHFFGIPGVFTAPWWPVKLTIFISAALCTVIFALKMLGPMVQARAASTPKHDPEVAP